MIKRHIFICLLITVCVNSAFTQDCLSLFRQSYENLRSVKGQPGKTGLLMKYTVETSTADGLKSTDKFELRSLAKKASVLSTDIDVYQDESTMVVVQKLSNVIFITRTIPQKEKQSQFSGMVGLQDSLVNNLLVKSCKSEPVQNCNDCKKIVLQLPSDLKKKSGVEDVTYWIKEESKEISKASIVFSQESGSPIKSVAYSIEQIDKSYENEPFEGSSLSIVMERGKLKSPYSAFELIDQRK